MKATLTITSRGVVTLPAKLRRALGLKAEDQLIAETTPEGLLLRPAVTLPLDIYTQEREGEFDEAEADLAALMEDRATSEPQARPRRPAEARGLGAGDRTKYTVPVFPSAKRLDPRMTASVPVSLDRKLQHNRRAPGRCLGSILRERA